MGYWDSVYYGGLSFDQVANLKAGRTPESLGIGRGAVTNRNEGASVIPTWTNPPVMPELPTYAPPEEYKAPVYEAPEYNEEKVKQRTQEYAAPAIRGLRSAIQRISSQYYENPNVKRMTLRDALAGYGQGLQSAMSQAAETGRSQYDTEYGHEVSEALTKHAGATSEAQTNYGAKVTASQMNYQATLSKAQSEYQAAINAYLNTLSYANKASYEYGGGAGGGSSVRYGGSSDAYEHFDPKTGAQYSIYSGQSTPWGT